MDDQLRRRSVGAPAARSLLLTILGEYVLPLGEAVWQETLVGALVSVGYTQQAARQALARSVRDGWIETSRHGRRARVSLSAGTAGSAPDRRSADLLLRAAVGMGRPVARARVARARGAARGPSPVPDCASPGRGLARWAAACG